jgi:hypothetical protein
MLAGTEATAASELEKVKEMPPSGAGPLRRTVPLPFWPPLTLAGERVSFERPPGLAQEASVPPSTANLEGPTSMAAPVIFRVSKQVG